MKMRISIIKEPLKAFESLSLPSKVLNIFLVFVIQKPDWGVIYLGISLTPSDPPIITKLVVTIFLNYGDRKCEQ